MIVQDNKSLPEQKNKFQQTKMHRISPVMLGVIDQ